jgi:hypothetical protein
MYLLGVLPAAAVPAVSLSRTCSSKHTSVHHVPASCSFYTRFALTRCCGTAVPLRSCWCCCQELFGTIGTLKESGIHYDKR